MNWLKIAEGKSRNWGMEYPLTTFKLLSKDRVHLFHPIPKQILYKETLKMIVQPIDKSILIKKKNLFYAYMTGFDLKEKEAKLFQRLQHQFFPIHG